MILSTLFLATAETAPDGSMWKAWALFAAAVFSLIATAIVSGSEIGLFSLSKVRLRLRTAKGDKNALRLAEWAQKPTYALEGLLIWQNITSFAFSAAVTGVMYELGYNEWMQGIVSIAIVTPMVLVFADIMPKDLFHAHADRWTYRMVPMMRVLFKLITWIPLLPLVNLLSHWSVKMVGSKRTAEQLPRSPRVEMLALFEESAATGSLSGTQQDMVQRALRLARISVREIMIPWNRVIGVPATISVEGFQALVRRYNISRMPVLGRSMTEVLGTIDVLDALTSHAGAGEKPFKLTEHLHPAQTLIGEQSVRSAITLMQKARQTLAVVVDRQGGAIGLVTMKDLIEELVGDLESW